MYGFGDGTYGEIGINRESFLKSFKIDISLSYLVDYFKDNGIKIKSIVCGVRYSVAIDVNG